MSSHPLPPPLKIPEVSRFINRANQLRTIKPAIAYWCEYHAVNQIVTKSLHNCDEDCFAFTKALIERLEATKTERADDDAIVDNSTGQAYVEQFAQETFARAERVMRADKVTRQTADTFDAAATFFDLTHEWGTPEPEVLKKIKFAKWNAARILKAIREGKDPNLSNPRIEEQSDHHLSPPNDLAELQITTTSSAPSAASIEEVEDAGEQHKSYFPPTSITPAGPIIPTSSSQSPVESTASGTPSVSVPLSPPLPTTSGVQFPFQQSPQLPTNVTSQFASPPLDPTALSSHSHASNKTGGGLPPPTAGRETTPKPVAKPAVAIQPSVEPAAHHHHHRAGSLPARRVLAPNPKNIEQAQKHAKWAISALNFEDVPTAVQELRNALALLNTE